MPTSGTSNFNPTIDDILQDAAGMVGGGPILAEELQSAMRGLDYLLTQIQNRNVLLHKIETTTIPVSANIAQVSLDSTVLDALSLAVRDSNDTAITIHRLGFESWAQIPNKDLNGRPVQYWFDRRLSGNLLNLWPAPDDTYDLVITIQKTAEDTVRAFNNVDVPRRFLPALIYGLAYYVGMRRGGRVPTERLQLLKAEYETALKEAMREDRERGSFFMKTQRML
jgi:hypothetical protein